MLSGPLDLSGGKLGLHVFDFIHARLNGAHGFEIFFELAAIAGAEAALQGTGIFQCEIGDVARLRVGLRAEESVINLARIAHGWRHMTGGVP